MSSAALYAFPTALTAPVQQTRRCGRFPRNVLNLQRIRCERNDNRSLEQARQAKANKTFRDQVRNALRNALYLDVDGRNMVGAVICAVDADGEHMGWAAGLFCEDLDAGYDALRVLLRCRP